MQKALKLEIPQVPSTSDQGYSTWLQAALCVFFIGCRGARARELLYLPEVCQVLLGALKMAYGMCKHTTGVNII